MSEANVTITARDATAAAFRSADARLKQFANSAASARRMINFLGVSLTARAFAGWISGALKAAEATGEHTAQIKAAQAAMTNMKAASDRLALSIGTQLTPAFVGLTNVMIGWNRIISGADPFQFEAQIEKLRSQLVALDAQLSASGGMPFEWRMKFVENITAIENRLDDLLKKQRQALGLDSGPAAQTFSFNRIGDVYDKFSGLKRPDVQLDQLGSPATGSMPWEGMDFKRLAEESERYQELRSETEELITAMMQDHLDRRRAAEEQYANDRIEREAFVAEETRYWQETAFSSASSLLRLVGEEHRGAAIAAIAIEKWMAIQRTLVQGKQAAAQIIALGEIAAWQAMAQIGPIGGPAVAAATRAKAAASAARVAAMSVASAVFTGLEGAVQVARLSSGGTAGQLGSPANPIFTTGGASSTAASVAGQSRNHKVAELHFHRGFVTTSAAVRELVELMKREMKDFDLVLVN